MSIFRPVTSTEGPTPLVRVLERRDVDVSVRAYDIPTGPPPFPKPKSKWKQKKRAARGGR